MGRESAHLLGWLVGDGSFSGDVISAVYGSDEDRSAILPRHMQWFTALNGGRAPKISEQANGTAQLRLSRRALAYFFQALGLKPVKAAEKDALVGIRGADRGDHRVPAGAVRRRRHRG